MSCRRRRTTDAANSGVRAHESPMPGVRTQNQTPPSRTSRPSLPLVRCYVTIFLHDISCQLSHFADVLQVTIRLMLACSILARTLHPTLNTSYPRPLPGEEP